MAVDEYPTLLNERIRAYRMVAGMSQGQLSAATGLPVNTIYRCERLRSNGGTVPTLDTAIRIAQALDVYLSDLVGDAEDGFTLAAAGLDAEVPG